MNKTTKTITISAILIAAASIPLVMMAPSAAADHVSASEFDIDPATIIKPYINYMPPTYTIVVPADSADVVTPYQACLDDALTAFDGDFITYQHSLASCLPLALDASE